MGEDDLYFGDERQDGDAKMAGRSGGDRERSQRVKGVFEPSQSLFVNSPEVFQTASIGF